MNINGSILQIYVKHAPSLTHPVNYQPHSLLPVEHLRLAVFALQAKPYNPSKFYRRNSLTSKSTVRPQTPLTAVVSNNYQNLCRSLDGLHGAHIKKSDSDPQIFERSQSLHSLQQDADSSEDAEQQEETASNSSRHSSSPILRPRRKNLHSSLNDIHQ
ncbi:Uncharacterized protein APZ42_013107 [Daphnia magna]|uniref:Uncharacterized protein n=1 Tax=Daphnia magna TaxID=35525 RepID=A0A162R678_9CRUS|nr:Uncharacterized protein APZ42_013107 [Daphnia magna]